MTGSSEILVLIANDEVATLCASLDGATRLLRKMDLVLPANDGHRGDDKVFDARNVFACELVMALCRGIREHSYEGVVIFADAPMMDELRRVQVSAVSRILLAEIVGTPFEASHFPGRGTANAGSIFKYAMQ